jgi:hypothetical protein
MIHTKPALRIAVLYPLLAALSACGGHAVDLDQAADVPKAEDASRIVNEPATALWTAGDHLFWTSTVSVGDNGRVRGCLTSGCDGSIIDYALAFPDSVVASPTHLVFARGSILACPIAGCGLAPSAVYAGHALRLALDADFVYWSELSDRSIYRCPISGCQVPSTVASGQVSLDDVLVVADGDVYWRSGDELRVGKGDGSEPYRVAVRRADTAQLAIVEQTAYFVDRQNQILNCAISDCADPQVLVPSTTEKFGLRADAGGVFWLEKNDAVHFCAASGCSTGPHAVTPPQVFTFAIDERYVYWSERVENIFASMSSPTMEAGVTGGAIHRTAR